MILVAAGYGSLRKEGGRPVSKLLEEIGGQPLVTYPVGAAAAAGVTDVIVVVNPLFGDPIREAIERQARVMSISTHYVVQPDRYGAADAVMRAIPQARALDSKRALIAYGDMPLWSWQTMRRVMEAGDDSAASMVTVARNTRFPGLDRYGRIVRDASGYIERVVEISDQRITPEELARTTVNPSLWCWCLDWLERNIPSVATVPRPDNGAPERHLPPLVGLARTRGMSIKEVRLRADRAVEALGVNSVADLELLRASLDEAWT